MAIFVSFGLCSAFGVFYGPVHSILPFLLLGIGIDDMFVIVQCWSNLDKEESKRSLPRRIGTTMKHAGVSITITSVTDFAAFAVGATTVQNNYSFLNANISIYYFVYRSFHHCDPFASIQPSECWRLTSFRLHFLLPG